MGKQTSKWQQNRPGLRSAHDMEVMKAEAGMREKRETTMKKMVSRRSRELKKEAG
jgi:hypothetical protein